MDTIVMRWLRTAAKLYAQWARSRPRLCSIQLPTDLWEEVQILARQVAQSQQHGWQLAADRQSQELLVKLESLQAIVAPLLVKLRAQITLRSIAGLADIYRDLLALAAEFPGVDYDLNSQTVSVITEPIQLAGVLLGPFQIRLDVSHMASDQEYRVVALQPNPANTNNRVTHPHVNDQALCAGDGVRAIRAALGSGRLYDFFTIVHQTLQTYAPGRAYVELENWFGVPCHDCGCTADENDGCACTRCEATLCADCGSPCSDCGEMCCANCSERCPDCGQFVCLSCRGPGGVPMCQDCLNHQFDPPEENHAAETMENFPD